MKLRSVHTEIRKALRKNRKGGIEGLPLQLMLVIIIATLGTAVIVGWMGNIEEPHSIGEVRVDSGEIVMSPVYSGTTGYQRVSENIVISVFDQSGNPLEGATVVLSGLGIQDLYGRTVHGVTGDDGTVTFTGTTLKMSGTIGYIGVNVSKAGYGEDSSCRITVVA